MNVELPTRSSHAPVRRRGAVAVIARGDELLVIRRSRNISAPGMFCFPGGGLEPGESEAAAVRRELREELGVAFVPARRLWRCQTAWQVDLAWWSGSLAVDAVLRPDPAEVESVHWHTLADLARLPNMLDSNVEFIAHVASGRIVLSANGLG